MMRSGWCAAVAVWCLFLTACQKVELPVEEGGSSSGSGQTVSGGEDDKPVTLPDEYADEWTVAEVLAAYSGVNPEDKISCSVVGYIVGYVRTSSIGSAVFSPEGAGETNLLIADRKGETRVGHCLPVELEKGSAIRADLNLANHPEVWGRRICITAYVSRYFSTVGLKKPESYAWVKDDVNVPEEPESGTDPEPDPNPQPDPEPNPDPVPDPGPDPEPQPEEERKDTLKVDEKPGMIPGGRSIPSWRKEDE